MRHVHPTLVLAVLLLSSIPSLSAQAPADPSGHWEGSVQGLARFEVDLAKNSKGELAGTFNMPDENLKGLALVQVSVEGPAVRFAARSDQTFQGVFSDDGKSISGEYMFEGFSIPFSLTRTGDARVEVPAKSSPIGKELEGAWNGTLDASGMRLRLVLTLSNQPDNTASGRIVNLDQGGLTIPVSILQQGTTLTLDAKAVGGTYSGTLNAEGTELVGTFSQAGRGVPLNFRRAGPIQ